MAKQSSIAKNTIYLYIRMIIIMLVTLYTTRVVLKELGVVDFGIYNIVGSVAISLVFIQNALSSATQRFFSYELGLENNGKICTIFSMSINIHALLAIITIIILETLGLWFVNSILNIPDNRISEANIAYQFSILTFLTTLLRIPHNAMIISQEKMNLYAIFSIIEAMLRLLVAYLLSIDTADKLVFYSFLLFGVALLTNILYWGTCRVKFRHCCKYSYNPDKALFKSMTSFLGWNTVGGIAGLGSVEGPTYLINIYWGVSVNAGLGIAKQVSSAVYSFSSNFQQAFNPQIIKTYAAENFSRLIPLVYNSSIMSYYLLFIFALPFIICSKNVLNLWIVDLPPYTQEFTVALVIVQLISAFGAPLWMLAHAIGNIRKYQLTISLLNLTIIPLGWAILAMGAEPFWIYSLLCLINIAILIYRVQYIQKYISLSSHDFYKMIIYRCLLPSILCLPIPLLLSFQYPDGWGNIITVTLASISVTGLFFWLFGIDRLHRNMIIDKIRNFIAR